MKIYSKEFARYYDVFYGKKNYLKEVDYIDRCLKKTIVSAELSLLEIACGTGTHSFLLEAKKRYDITAIDYSNDMIAVAKEKAMQKKSSVKFSVSDMRKLPNYQKKFDVAICLFDSLGYCLTNDSIKSTLNGVRRNLKHNGLFIFEFWHAAAMIKHFDNKRVRYFVTKNNERIKRTSYTSIDYTQQSCTVKYDVEGVVKTKRKFIYKETHKNRFFLVQEMRLFLNECGFVPVKFTDGFSHKMHINEKSWHIVCIAKRIK